MEMISNSKIKLLRSLEHKKFRQQHGLFIAEGRKIILELLRSKRFEIDRVFVLHESLADIPAEQLKNIDVEEISYNAFERISQLTTPDFGLAVLRIPEKIPLRMPAGQELFLLLDSIRDPGNLGTIIRLCDWFGVSQVICSEDSVDMFAPKVIQATMGSFSRVGVSYTDHLAWLKSLPQNIHVYGTVLNGESLPSVKPQFPAVVVIGNESHGISADVLQCIRLKVTIPGASQSGAESLNAAMAAGIVLYEFIRNR
jgi:RNA methyltransferase, TrmH family